ncbi:PREDICTED: protein singed-like [Priapulus caudatus]|uniref:Fascin n=1 Tax=Priapulus caudatus TaxID=37621 RepID=A0ABM1EQ39_PRICU|nr:PREDICTED: protein singed-like [Priapulus caudatus]
MSLTNGSNNGHSSSSGGGGAYSAGWNIGLINSHGKYLTAETFGFKINASGSSMKRKQIWTLEQNGGDSVVSLRSHMGRYMSTDKFGNVTCEAEDCGPSEGFSIEISKDGRWAFKSVEFGYYFGGVGDNLRCTSKASLTDDVLWSVHLAVHPQVNLRNVNRKRYAHLREEEMHVDENIPWGRDALVTLELREGKYAVKTCDDRYLHRDGRLVDEADANTLYRLEFHGGYMALKDCAGRYLTAVGADGHMKSRNSTVTKDELFSVEESHPQASFVAHNGRRVSTKQGVDLSANQEELTDTEIFQIERVKTSKKWLIRTKQDKYWSLESGGGIQAKSSTISPSCHFDLDWQQNGSVAVKAPNGRYVTAKMNGQLSATIDEPTAKEHFRFQLINRPIMVLRGSHGFVGFKSTASRKLECNKSSHDIIKVEQNEDGSYFLKDRNNHYWHIEDDYFITTEGAPASEFYLELQDHTLMSIRSKSGYYLRGEQSGLFKANGTEIKNDTLWEF